MHAKFSAIIDITHRTTDKNEKTGGITISFITNISMKTMVADISAYLVRLGNTSSF